MSHVRGGSRTERGGAAPRVGIDPRGFIRNFDVPTELSVRRVAHGIVLQEEALRRAEPSAQTTGNVSYADYLSPEDEQLLKRPLADFQALLASGLRRYVGTNIVTAVHACVGAESAKLDVKSLSLADDTAQEPTVLPVVILRYFLVPDWYEYVLHIIVRIDERPENTGLQLVPEYEGDDRAPFYLLVTSVGKSAPKRAREPTFV